jgi:hypothetical protein
VLIGVGAAWYTGEVFEKILKLFAATRDVACILAVIHKIDQTKLSLTIHQERHSERQVNTPYEDDSPTQKASPQQDSWFPGSHGDPERP